MAAQFFSPVAAADGLSLPPHDVLSALQAAAGKLAPDAAELFGRALAFVTEAEQRICEQERRIQELECLSSTDALTGLLNRRGFEEALHRALASSVRHGEEGVLAYIDLDHFKQINDSFGHQTGDAVLKHVATILNRTVRATDYVARLGGDEFAVIFTSTAPQACRPILQKLRRALAGASVQIDGRTIHLRASVGTESFGRDTDSSSLLAAADKAMYRTKQRRVARAA